MKTKFIMMILSNQIMTIPMWKKEENEINSKSTPITMRIMTMIERPCWCLYIYCKIRNNAHTFIAIERQCERRIALLKEFYNQLETKDNKQYKQLHHQLETTKNQLRKQYELQYQLEIQINQLRKQYELQHQKLVNTLVIFK
jgi:hypothetical protein